MEKESKELVSFSTPQLIISGKEEQAKGWGQSLSLLITCSLPLTTVFYSSHQHWSLGYANRKKEILPSPPQTWARFHVGKNNIWNGINRKRGYAQIYLWGSKRRAAESWGKVKSQRLPIQNTLVLCISSHNRNNSIDTYSSLSGFTFSALKKRIFISGILIGFSMEKESRQVSILHFKTAVKSLSKFPEACQTPYRGILPCLRLR